MKTILDTDPGIDDAMTFYYAHSSSSTDLIALTSVFGNVTVEHATRNALWLAESVDQRIPVFEGADAPLSIPDVNPSAHVHGRYGFGDKDRRKVHSQKEAKSAAEFLASEAARHRGELTVCAIGPLTNIALAQEIDPSFVSNLRQLVIMGGSLYAGGNITPYAEANFWHDPHAANDVLSAPGGGSIVIVGLDVTTKVSFSEGDFADLAARSPQVGGFLNDIGQFYMKFYETVTGKYQAFLHDPTAMIACEAPELFSMEDVGLNVVTEGERIGEMVANPTSERTCKVCINVDNAQVAQRYKEGIAQLR